MHTLKSFVLAGSLSVSSLLVAGCSSLPSWLGGTPTPAEAPAAATPAPDTSAPPSYAAPAQEHAMHHHALGTKDMRNLQHALAREGYYHGRIDGRNGPQTKDAVARYQQNLGVQPANGDIDDQTRAALGVPEAKP